MNKPVGKKSLVVQTLTLDAFLHRPENLQNLIQKGLVTVSHLRAHIAEAVIDDERMSLATLRSVGISLRYKARAEIALQRSKPGSVLVIIHGKSGPPCRTADPQIAAQLLTERIQRDAATAVRVVMGIERARKRLLEHLDQATRWI